jgi:phage tail sheath gpL-like
MASISATISLGTKKDPADLLNASQEREVLNRLANLVNSLKAGHLSGTVALSGSTDDATFASGTFTLASVIATDACTIGKTTFTFTSTPSTSTATAQDVEVDGSGDAADAAALAAAINANEATKLIVYATSSGAVVTVTSRVPGVIGNYINISDADSTITTSGAYLTGGAGGTSAVANPLTISR